MQSTAGAVGARGPHTITEVMGGSCENKKIHHARIRNNRGLPVVGYWLAHVHIEV